MNIDTNTVVSMNEVNKDFSKVIKIADKCGEAVILKDNKPKYIVLDIEKSDYIDISDDEKIDVVAARILKKFKPAFMELAK